MPVRARSLTVYFYVIEPMPGVDGHRGRFVPGKYPLEEVLQRLRDIDTADETNRLQDHLWGGQTLCVLHEDGARPILGAYYRDDFNRALTEYKGEIRELMLRDGEALVDAAYAAFFPADVIGIVRTSSKSPKFAKIGQWLSVHGGYDCGLIALPDADALQQLDRVAGRLQRLRLRIKRSHIARVDAYSKEVAQALRAVTAISPPSDVVGFDIGSVSRSPAQAASSAAIRAEIEEIFTLMPEFEEATVKVAGMKRPINLRRALLTAQVDIALVDKSKVGRHEAAKALFEGYAQEKASIDAGIAAWANSRRGGRETAG